MSAVLTQPATAHLLDGRRFDGIVLERGKTSGDADSLSFDSGRFRSSACDRYGHGDGADAARALPAGGVEFECRTESPVYGQLHWRGVVQGKRMDATLTMVPDGVSCGEKWILAGQL